MTILTLYVPIDVICAGTRSIFITRWTKVVKRCCQWWRFSRTNARLRGRITRKWVSYAWNNMGISISCRCCYWCNNIRCFQLLLQIMFIGHHPPGGSSSIILPTRDFQTLVANYSDLIVMQVAGHTHFDHYKVVWRTIWRQLISYKFCYSTQYVNLHWRFVRTYRTDYQHVISMPWET